MTKEGWRLGPYRWSREYEDQIMDLDDKPAKKNKAKEPIKLKDEPLMTEQDWIALGFVLFILFGIFTIWALNKGQEAEAILPPVEVEQTIPKEGPGKTWKEPGSSRDIFNENFQR